MRPRLRLGARLKHKDFLVRQNYNRSAKISISPYLQQYWGISQLANIQSTAIPAWSTSEWSPLCEMREMSTRNDVHVLRSVSDAEG
jgi:hypothetical protein